MFPAKPNDFTHSPQKAEIMEDRHSQSLWGSLFCLSWLQLVICLHHTCNTQRGKEDVKHTWFLKERCRTGSSAAREMLLSKMKNRIRLVKMLSLTIRWQWTRNLQEKREARLYLSKNTESWEIFPPSSSSASRTRGLPCRAPSLCPSAGRTCAGQCWLSTLCRTHTRCVWMENSHSLLTELFVISMWSETCQPRAISLAFIYRTIPDSFRRKAAETGFRVPVSF